MAHLTRQAEGSTEYAYVTILTATQELGKEIVWSNEPDLDRKVVAFRGDHIYETALLAVSDFINDVKHLTLNGNDLTDYYVSQNTVLRDDAKLDKIRSDRNGLLSASDWTQLADVPLDPADKQAWATYRQQLRDFPASPELDIDNPVWPTPPS